MILTDEVVIYRLSDGLLLCQSLGSTGDIRCNLSLSPRGFQLPTFRAGWFSTANLSCWLVLIRCNLSLTSGVSAAILLVHGYFSAVIFLSPQGFQLPFFCIHEYFSASCSLASLSSAVSAASPYLHVVAE